jgi:hypothetical protein
MRSKVVHKAEARPDQWHLKRLDFRRPSAQHRAAAWKASFEIMRDHPFDVGWNKAVKIYEKNYSPPEDGATAITTNDYLMLGTQLSLPGLICFISYVALRLRSPKPKVKSPKSGNGATLDFGRDASRLSRGRCRVADSFFLTAGCLTCQQRRYSGFFIIRIGTDHLAVGLRCHDGVGRPAGRPCQ